MYGFACDVVADCKQSFLMMVRQRREKRSRTQDGKGQGQGMQGLSTTKGVSGKAE